MNEGLLSVSEFSRLSGISRKTLIFYDREGVFSPNRIGKNRYRLYSPRQLQVANVIVSLRDINVPLAEIKAFLGVRTPGKLADLCRRQEKRVAAELKKLGRARDVVQSLQAATESAADAKPGRIAEKDLPPARLFMGPPIVSTDMAAINEALSAFHELCAARDIPPAHPLGSVTGLSNIARAGEFRPARFYRPAGQEVADSLTTTRPGGRYLVGYARGDYGMLAGFYRRMLRHAKRKGYAILGDAYEEYLVSEMAVSNPGSYLARVGFRIS